jgi:tetratricopeptide (TPR) repeat protein
MLGLGKCFAKLGRLDKAIEFYENIQKKADENQLNSIVIQASRELIEIYDKMAERYMQANEDENNDKALYFLEKCLQVIFDRKKLK